METITIVTFGVMLIIALLKLRSNKILLESLTNKLDAEENANKSYVEKNKDWQKQFDRLKYKLEKQDTLLETKYKSSLVKINERDQVIRERDIQIMALSAEANVFNKGYIGLDNEVNELQKSIDEKDAIIKLRDSEIFKLKKWNTNLTNVSKKTDEIIQDFILRIQNSEKQKDAAIKKADKAIKLCKESVATVAYLRAELDSIEVLLSKYNLPPSLSL